MSEQKAVLTAEQDTVETMTFEPIKGYPMLNWRGKRPFTSTRYYPAQIKERHGEPVDGWMNKIYWGDNLQVMSHLLREYRGKVKLIYIDPPYDSNADYKKRIKISKLDIQNEMSTFEEKQYTDIWTNDEYLQFIYDRLLVLRELLGKDGSVFVHCDYHKSHYLRCILEEIFSKEGFVNEIVWRRKGGSALGNMSHLSVATDTIFWFSKSTTYTINPVYGAASQDYIEKQFTRSEENGRRYMVTVMRSPNPRPNLRYDYKGYKTPPNGWAVPLSTMERLDREGRLYFPESKEKQIYKKLYLDEYPGQAINNLWFDIATLKGNNKEITNYPTQKPEELVGRILELASRPNDLVLDCFMGSGTTQAVAMKLGRRFIGADINLGAVQTTTNRLIQVTSELFAKVKNVNRALSDTTMSGEVTSSTLYTGFEVYNVNHYDVFRNPVEAKQLLLEALEVNPLAAGNLFDGEKDGRMVKVMPVNRIATRADLNELIANFDIRAFERQQAENPHEPVERVTLVCMGHEADLAAQLKAEMLPYNLDVEVVDILRDKQDLVFKRDSEAKITHGDGTLTIEQFYPMNLLTESLASRRRNVEDWRELVESVMIDWNYGGGALEPATVDIPEKDELVKGSYPVPDDAGTIRVKITDVLSESLEVTL